MLTSFSGIRFFASRRWRLMLGIAISATGLAGTRAQTPMAVNAPTQANQDPRARALLDAAKTRMQGIRSLRADFSLGGSPSSHFERGGEITVERPNKFRVDVVSGGVTEESRLQLMSDGQTITEYSPKQFVAYRKPVRAENFFLGVNFLVQFFFDPREINFDPTDASWGRAISQFDTNRSAYDQDTQLAYIGSRVLQGRKYEVVEIKYNTRSRDLRQQIYIGEDGLIYEVDLMSDGGTYAQKFRNFRIDPPLPASMWIEADPAKMPVVETDPVRMGQPGPNFTLPGANGGEIELKQLLKGKKGLYVCVLDGTAGRTSRRADHHLPQMRVLQDMKNKFEAQGLAVVCIVGGAEVTPDLKNEMLMNWLPDLKRFNYPIAIDIDLEKGIQGSAYQNFQLGGRNNLLLDGEGRVVFAAENFDDPVNQLAFYQALAQIGFAVSAAELEDAVR